MQFEKPLIPGRLVKRYKRFLADVTLDNGETITAHCANPGAMTGLADPGIPVWLSLSDDPKRKLKYSLEMVEVDDGRGPARVGINTAHPNRLVEAAITDGAIPELSGYAGLRREVRYGSRNSRIDMLLEDEARPPCYVEVKNVHLVREPGLAEFPDSVTTRGAKHLAELADMATEGARAVMVYLVQRGDCDRFTLATDIDPAYGQAFAQARKAGVEAVCYACDVSPEAIRVTTPVKIIAP
ncbi:MAG: DNA/RNA nuclease SfsA [Rhodobiaceae bacterium]|nr:DNA/RNA nuclease SfsA [Rhodobiaceae bacterium]MCC0048900.1 DNA/RNA nuclease SfsA [Rhodobiaceae bacterium]